MFERGILIDKRNGRSKVLNYYNYIKYEYAYLNNRSNNINLKRCKNALRDIWYLNRVHVSEEMSLAYRRLKKYFTS